MKSMTFALLLLGQRADDLLRSEAARSRPDPSRLDWLRRRKRRILDRLTAKPRASALTGG